MAQIDGRRKDRYDRPPANVMCAGVHADAEQVRRGMAVGLQQYAPTDSPLYEAQVEAGTTNRELWQHLHSVPPWSGERESLIAAADNSMRI